MATACGHCQFSLAQCDAAFGAGHTLETPLSDRHRVLSRGDRTQILNSLSTLSRRFPQLRTHVVIQPCPESPFPSPACYLFWLFNRGGFAGPMEKGGRNHHLLLWIDPEERAIRCTIGYGLEPWISPTVLTRILQAGSVGVGREDWGGAVEQVTVELSVQFAAVTRVLPKTLGLYEDRLWIDLDEEDIDAALSDRSVSIPY